MVLYQFAIQFFATQSHKNFNRKFYVFVPSTTLSLRDRWSHHHWCEFQRVSSPMVSRDRQLLRYRWLWMTITQSA